MSSLIEQAAQRLEQLRAAGVEIPIPSASIQAEPTVSPARSAPATSLDTVTSRKVDVDLDRLGAAGIVTPLAPRSATADQFRVVKRPLIDNAMGKGASTINHANLIMVTSALPGEGKSFTAINLAMSIAAELDNTVMLVDADVARPSVLNVLGLPPSPGLLDLIDGSAEMWRSCRSCPAARRTRRRPSCSRAMRCANCSTTWPSAIPTASSSSTRRRSC
jgi:protein-tyrosine kinase